MFLRLWMLLLVHVDIDGFKCHWWEHALWWRVGAVRNRLSRISRVEVRYLCGSRGASNVACGSHMRWMHSWFVPACELHLNLQLFGFLRRQRLYGSILTSFSLHFGWHACPPMRNILVLLWVTSCIRATRHIVMVSDRLDLAFWNLLDLFGGLGSHCVLRTRPNATVRCLRGREVGRRQVRSLLLRSRLGFLRSSHRASHHVFETADHFRALRPFVVSLSRLLLLQVGALLLSLVTTLHMVDQLVLDLIRGLDGVTSRALRRIVGAELNTLTWLDFCCLNLGRRGLLLELLLLSGELSWSNILECQGPYRVRCTFKAIVNRLESQLVVR